MEGATKAESDARTRMTPRISAWLRPPRMDSSDVLPEPLGPSTPSMTPGWISPLTACRIWRRFMGGAKRSAAHRRRGAAMSGTRTKALRRRHSTTSGAASGGGIASPKSPGGGGAGAPSTLAPSCAGLSASIDTATNSAGPPVPRSASSSASASADEQRCPRCARPSSEARSSDSRAWCGSAVSSIAGGERAGVVKSVPRKHHGAASATSLGA